MAWLGATLRVLTQPFPSSLPAPAACSSRCWVPGSARGPGEAKCRMGAGATSSCRQGFSALWSLRKHGDHPWDSSRGSVGAGGCCPSPLAAVIWGLSMELAVRDVVLRCLNRSWRGSRFVAVIAAVPSFPAGLLCRELQGWESSITGTLSTQGCHWGSRDAGSKAADHGSSQQCRCYPVHPEERVKSGIHLQLSQRIHEVRVAISSSREEETGKRSALPLEAAGFEPSPVTQFCS
ncbi:uncharacterized protein LOC127467260 [Manacus candei]|uniref:uncharacterized protein LOC127467260 n=1 Tax=Manacus candei TaxID=415023 RepID=UPI0022266409|nr:uncharacterized protein LOC127467260 [Manacus candei]